MGEHCAQQRRIVQGGIVQSQFQIGRAFFADGLADRDAGSGDERLQRLAAWRMLQVIDNLRFDAGVADQGKGIAGGSATGIVVDDGVHGGLALDWLVAGGAGNGCPNDAQTGQCTSGARACRALPRRAQAPW